MISKPRHNFFRKKFILWIGMIALMGYTSTISAATLTTMVVTDIAGRKVTIPAQVERVACICGPSYEKVFMLGQKGKIALRMPLGMPWATQTNPQINQIPVIASYQDPNIEDLLAKKIDVVLFWDYPGPVAKMTAAGIPVVVTQISAGNPDNIKDFIRFAKREVMLFGEVLGPDAQKKAAEWCANYDAKIKYVTSRTAKIPESQRPKVYYVRGPEALVTHGRNSYTAWYVEMAGGDMVSKNTTEEGMTTVTMEQVLKWDPDVVFMGRVNNTDLILKDPKWSNVKAVKEGKVYVNPAGVMHWDYSSEGVLLLEYLAKKLHPDLFKDLNMVEEVKTYYEKFYQYKLTDEEANRILQYLPPQ